jgi:hypothetical protein
MSGAYEPTIRERGGDASPDSLQADRWSRCLRFVPVVTALCFAFIGIRYLYRAHPSEDAFILFKYVEDFVRGFGIVYYPGGPHAEGATDFLWFLLLSGLRYLGMDVAVAACLLGALGAGLASYLCCQAVERSGARGPAAFVFGALSLSVLYLYATLAGYLGFSAMFYAPVFLALALLVLWAERGILWTPFLALALALIRPDGVVPAILFAGLGILRARECRCALRYVAWSSLAVGIGAAYYAWRLDYFGLLLPLPLYVKSRQAPTLTPLRFLWSIIRLPLNWVLNDPSLKALTLATALLFLYCAFQRGKRIVRPMLVFVPYFVHSVMMGYATQMQNVAGRFQAPERLAILFALIACGTYAWQGTRRCMLRAAIMALCIGPLGYEASVGWRALRNYESAHLYVDTFAPEFGRLMGPERVIALTEAGRLSYWTSARVEDTIGLNTPRTALAPPDLKYFEELSPDVMMFHVGLTNLKNALRVRTEPVVEISTDLLGQCIRPEHAEIYRDGIATYNNAAPDTVAAILMARYLAVSQEYDLYAVRYGNNFNHVFAIKKGLPEEARIVELLRETASGSRPYRSYATVEHFWLADGYVR